MIDKQFPQFDATKPDGFWGQFTSGFQVAPILLGPPVAIQIFGKDDSRIVHTGVIASTQDTYSSGRENDDPIGTLIYFVNAQEPLRIEWMRIGYALAEVAVTEWEGKPS
jgi:hypothetical protein